MEGKVNTKNFIRQNAIWLVFIFEVIFFAIFSQGTFVTPGNITNILRQVSYYGIASVGMTFVILIAGIDLSIGSIITLVNMVCAYMMVNMNCHWTIAVLASLVIGVLIGFVLYLLHAKDWLPDLVRSGVRTLSGLSTPLCLFGLGVRLAVLDLKKLFTQPFVYGICAVKLLLFPLFCYALALLLPYSPVFRASMLILGATPCASVILSLAEIHNSGQSLAANCALLTTLLSVITIPLLSFLV